MAEEEEEATEKKGEGEEEEKAGGSSLPSSAMLKWRQHVIRSKSDGPYLLRWRAGGRGAGAYVP